MGQRRRGRGQGSQDRRRANGHRQAGRDHRYLGLTLRPLSADEASELGLQTNGGLLITQIEPGSPAAEAGLGKNMVIVMIGNRQITDVRSLPHELLNMQAGTNVRLQVLVIETLGPLKIQRGGSVMLTAR
ncbi:MAG: PDZ domain-containing protein [Verrucomicrobiota bacterium]